MDSLFFVCLFCDHLFCFSAAYRGVPEEGPPTCAHTCLAGQKKRGEVSPALIDSFISAEIPDPIEDPLGFFLVVEFMMHGPCGRSHPKCPCMKDGRCSKKYPKEFKMTPLLMKLVSLSIGGVRMPVLLLRIKSGLKIAILFLTTWRC